MSPTRLRGVLVALLIGLSVAATAIAAQKIVKGRAFTTKAPEGWSVMVEKTDHNINSRGYALVSAGKLDAVSIPRKGEIGISIYENVLRTDVGKITARDILDSTAGRPTKATHVKRTRPKPTTVHGVSSVSITLAYTSKGRRIRQHDTAFVRGRYGVIIETDSDRSNVDAATDARAEVLSRWKWR